MFLQKRGRSKLIEKVLDLMMLTALSRDQNYQLGPARFQVGSSNTRVALLADTPIKTSDMTAHLEDVTLDGNCGNNGAVIEVSLKLLFRG